MILDLQKLLAAARQASETKAVAEISHFHVGAAFQLSTGEIVASTNVETETLNLTQCAERNGLMELIQTHRNGSVTALAIFSAQADSVSPSGSCRQLMAEYLAPETAVVFLWKNQEILTTVADLLPYTLACETLRIEKTTTTPRKAQNKASL